MGSDLVSSNNTQTIPIEQNLISPNNKNKKGIYSMKKRPLSADTKESIYRPKEVTEH